MAKKISKLVQVDIAGRTYSLSTTDDPEDLRLLADYVTTRILRIKRESGASPLDCATIAAMELAEDLNLLTARYEKLEAQLKRRTAKAASGAKAQDKPQGKDAEGAQA